MRKISKQRFVEALKNNDLGLTNLELAAQLGITEQYFYKLKKKYGEEIRLAARELAANYAIDALKDLKKQSKDGKTQATALLLELSKVKEQASLLSSDGSWRISIEKIEKEPEKAE